MAHAIRKRIALAAAVAVSAGLLTAVPAQAAAGPASSSQPFHVNVAEYVADAAGVAIPVGNRDGGGDTATDTTLAVQHPAGTSNYIEITAAANLASATGRNLRVDVTGSTITTAGATTSGTSAVLNTARTSATYDTVTITGAVLRIATAVAGNFTVRIVQADVINGVSTDTVLQTMNVTVNAAPVSGVVSAAKSTSVISSDTTYTDGDEVIVANSAVATGKVANIKVVLLDANGVAVEGKQVTASISGPGTLGIADNTEATTATGRSITSAPLAAGTKNTAYVGVFADGTSGVATITISVGSTVIATETVSFYGSAAKMVATVLKPHIAATATGGVAAAVSVAVTDANGVVIPTGEVPTVSATSGTSATLSGGSYNSTDKVVYYTAASTSASGSGTTTFTLRSQTNTNLTATVSIVITKPLIASLVLTSDKATYAPGEKIKLNLTAKDADGTLMGAYASDQTIFVSAMTASSAVQGSLFGTALNFNAGVATTELFAPLGSGTVTFSAKTVSAAPMAVAEQGVTKSLSVTVSGPSELAQIKADLAALQKSTADLIAALAAQISYLRKQLNQLLRRR